MGKKKNKLSVVNVAYICGMAHLNDTQMRKYGRKMYKNAPSQSI